MKSAIKKPLALLSGIVLAFSLSACGNRSDTGKDTAQDSQTTQKEVPAEKEAEPEIPHLEGKWALVANSESDAANATTTQEATITADTITINWVTTADQSTNLYWTGSFEPMSEYVEEYTWTSQGNMEEMQASLLASQSETKDFTYNAKDDSITYDVSAMGETATVQLKRAE